MLADGEYDAIVMGTGLKEAIMSGLLSTLGMKVSYRLVAECRCWCWCGCWREQPYCCVERE